MNMNSISDDIIIQAICRSLDFHIITFSKDMFDKKYMYPIYPKHSFVIDILNMLGMPLDLATKTSSDNAIAYHDKILWSNKELFDFVKTELVPKLLTEKH